MLFRHLFQCQLIQRQLNRALTPQTLTLVRPLEIRMDILRHTMGRLRSLKSKMTYFLQVMSTYTMMEVLEHRWKAFIVVFKQVSVSAGSPLSPLSADMYILLS